MYPATVNNKKELADLFLKEFSSARRVLSHDRGWDTSNLPPSVGEAALDDICRMAAEIEAAPRVVLVLSRAPAPLPSEPEPYRDELETAETDGLL
jgi:hypothetical protein